MKRLVIIGAGGHAASVADSIDREQYELYGFIDEVKSGTYIGKPIFGTHLTDVPGFHDCVYIVGIGDVFCRKRWFNAINEMKLEAANVIDSTARISAFSQIGVGNFIGKFAVVDAGVMIGNNNLLNTMALVEHGSRVADHTNISTRATINGDVAVEDCVFVGSNATCLGQIALGEGAVIGAGSVVTKNVLSKSIVAGVPAREIIRAV